MHGSPYFDLYLYKGRLVENKLRQDNHDHKTRMSLALEIDGKVNFRRDYLIVKHINYCKVQRLVFIVITKPYYIFVTVVLMMTNIKDHLKG